jgi:hypothetical protein
VVPNLAEWLTKDTTPAIQMNPLHVAGKGFIIE